MKGRIHGSSIMWLFTRVSGDTPDDNSCAIRFKKKAHSSNLIVSVGKIVRRLRYKVSDSDYTDVLLSSSCSNSNAYSNDLWLAHSVTDDGKIDKKGQENTFVPSEQ